MPPAAHTKTILKSYLILVRYGGWMSYPLSRVQFLVLATLARQPMHLYALRQEINELTDHTYYPTSSTLKKAVRVLMAAGYIEECYSNPHYWLKAKRGRPYELTDQGRWRLDREVSMYFHACQVVRGWRQRHRHRDNEPNVHK